ncbi:MAG: hypothetical protein LBJ82_02510 [Deltaproteobacteria bacterium]|jgi:hypothetical protein|nr:hypothetical protein [Deltaproteobacteria bacterium]
MSVAVTGRDTGLISVICAVLVADFLSKQGLEAVPASPGRPGYGAALVLRRFSLKRPKEYISLAGRQVVLLGSFPAPAGAKVLVRLDPGLPVALAPDLPPAQDSLLRAALAPAQVSPCGAPQGGWACWLKSMYDSCGMELSGALAGALLCLLLTEADGPAAREPETAETLARLAGVADLAALGRDLA